MPCSEAAPPRAPPNREAQDRVDWHVAPPMTIPMLALLAHAAGGWTGAFAAVAILTLRHLLIELLSA